MLDAANSKIGKLFAFVSATSNATPNEKSVALTKIARICEGQGKSIADLKLVRTGSLFFRRRAKGIMSTLRHEADPAAAQVRSVGTLLAQIVPGEDMSAIATLENTLKEFDMGFGNLQISEEPTSVFEEAIAIKAHFALAPPTPTSSPRYDMPYEEFAALVRRLTGRTQRWQTDFCDLTGFHLHVVQTWRQKGIVPEEAVYAAYQNILPSRLKKTKTVKWNPMMQHMLAKLKRSGESNNSIAQKLSERFGIYVNANMVKGQWHRLQALEDSIAA